MPTLTQPAITLPHATLPKPDGDFYQVTASLKDSDRDVLKRVRAFMESQVAPVINKYWAEDSFPFELVPGIRDLKIAGAGLDVYEREPAVHPGLISNPSVVLAPHIASATVRTRSEMSAMAARNMATAVRGGRPPNLLNPEAKK